MSFDCRALAIAALIVISSPALAARRPDLKSRLRLEIKPV